MASTTVKCVCGSCAAKASSKSSPRDVAAVFGLGEVPAAGGALSRARLRRLRVRRRHAAHRTARSSCPPTGPTFPEAI